MLRARLPGRPTRDCLFNDPARDGTRYVLHLRIYLYFLLQRNQKLKLVTVCDDNTNVLYCCSLLKIWNMNKCSGVVGVFNCQGAGWCRIEKKTRIHDTVPGTLTGSVNATDVDSISEIAGQDWNGDVIVYMYRSGKHLPNFMSDTQANN